MFWIQLIYILTILPTYQPDMTNELWAGSRSIVEPYSDYVSIDAVYTPDPAQPIVALPGVLFYHQGPGVFMSIQKLTVDGLRSYKDNKLIMTLVPT